jgi:excisionase family DNA binding protein
MTSDEPKRMARAAAAAGQRSKARVATRSVAVAPANESASDRQLLYRVEEVARLYGVGRTTMYALIRDGMLHAVHIGRSCRITRAEAERFARSLDARNAMGVAPQATVTRRRRTAANQGELFDVGPPTDAADEAKP